MDAQNASEVDQSKSATATRRRASDAESKHSSKSVDQQLTASPEAKSSKPKVASSSNKTNDIAASDIDERDSDAETIVLPGKDGHSPSKVRKMRQDINTSNDGDSVKHSKAHLDSAVGAPTEFGSKSVDSSKRRRPSTSAPRDKNPLARSKDGSSGLSSAPASPPRDGRGLHRRRRSNASPHRSSDSEVAANRVSSGKSTNDRLKLGDRLPSAKRKAPRTDSDDEDDHHRKPRRQRTTSISNEASRPQRERFSESRNRSHSPPTRLHRRSASTQLVNSSSGGLSQKKRRLPPPLQHTDQHSDDSDRSGSPLPRSSKLRSLATPAATDANVSPAKIMPPKKHLDAHGQTFLARACARGEYDAVKKRLGERPEDINIADYAGNTPLQIAAINGCEDIVKLLIDAGCNMDCVNYDKDTPLLDAVDNGHLGVVKLLLDAGVNPRKANVSGQEPIDRITEETENADEIRTLLLDARKRAGERRRTSEDRHSHPDSHDARDSHAPDSPRHSPAMTLAGHTGRRSGTGRATKTRNDLLYMPLDDKTLRQAAGRGDEETVARILQVKEGCNDPECMVAAARGGHDLVIQLLLGLGSANPDPGPVPSLQPEFATPILAAIGQENIKVVELLLEQGGFDPTRRFKGETYYEIARKRQGTNWKEEENLLKNAYDEYKRAHKDVARTGKSPGRREREREREEKRARREEASRDESRAHKRNMSSPTRDNEGRKRPAPQRITSPKERRRLEPGRHAKEDRTSSTHTSDRETSPAISQKASKAKNRDADAAVSSDGEALKPRRKLVSKGELRGEREKHRRSSMASNASLKEPSSPQEPRADDPAADKPKMSEKYHDRTKALKREESKDPAANGNDGQAKRYRSSVTPDGHNHGDKDDAIPQKRRRLDADGQEKRIRPPSSPESRHTKLSASRDGSKVSSKANRKSIEDETNQDAKDSHHKREPTRKDPARPSATESSVRVKREDDDVQMPDVETLEASSSQPQDKKKKRELAEQEEAKKELDRQHTEAKRQADERKRAEARQEEERKRAEAEESKLREEEELKRRKLAEKARLEQEEQERAEEEKRRKKKEEEEEEERRKQEEERIRQEEEKKQEEAERKKVEEDERVRREQLEREAADAARRKREEDQRKERERRERTAREEIERKRAVREAEQRRVREEQEKVRLDKLPPLMRWLDLHPNPKARVVAERFRQVQGCRYDTIDPATNGTAEGREEWVLNTAVALLLGEKDLTLSRYSAWERVPVSNLAKETIWRTEWMHYSLASQQYFDIGREVPGLYPHEPTELTSAEKEDIKRDAWERFRALPMFFVKVSELLYTIPQIPHLRDVMIGVGYRELQEPEGSSPAFKVVSKPFRYLAKHLSDPNMDRYHGRAPRWRWYLNGNFVEEDLPKRAITSKLPFVERPVPRRGLLAVNADDPDYLKICREQGITPLIKGQPSPTLTNGSRDTVGNASAGQKVNGVHGTNGTLSTPENSAINSHVVNGINGSS